MNRLAATLALGVALAACNRNLEVPPPDTLVVSDAFPRAAPREALALSASGGAAPYTFAFAPGGNGSGPDATVNASTGAYVAGSSGPATDVVRVRDAAGATADIRITVGAPLSVAPTSAFVAPGGRVSFVASGGKPPYVLEVATPGGPGAVDGTDYLAPPSGGCTGTVSPPGAVALRLRDATGAAPVDLAVTIGRGLDLFPAAGTGSVAPFEQIAFVASGGQPPYEFSADAPIPSDGAGIDPGRGTYAAGPVGDVADRVRVTDANGEQRCFDVTVGPPLSVALSTSEARAGRVMRLVASGGRPPYAFSFAFKGNRSRGDVDPVTGLYLPGLNAGATDLVLVEDATGAPPLGPIAIPVGPPELDTGAANGGCAAADVDGDGKGDAVSVNLFASVTTVRTASSGLVSTRTYATPNVREWAAGDLDGDGDTDVAFIDLDGQVRTLLGTPDGTFVDGPRTVLNGFASHLAMARGRGEVVLQTSDPTPCGAGASGRIFVALTVSPATGTFGAPVCLTTEPLSPQNILAGDWNGDGALDLAYSTTTTPGTLVLRTGGGPAPWVARSEFVLPSTWRIDRNTQLVNPMLEVRRDGAAASDLVAIAIDAPRTQTFRSGLAVLRGGATPALAGVLPLQLEDTFNVLGVNAIGPGPGGVPRIAAWSGSDGATVTLDLPLAGGLPVVSSRQEPPRTYRVGCVAGADLDGDLVDDLLVLPRDTGTRGELLRGDGDGGYGRRPRFAAVASAIPAGDLDGDGQGDLLGTSPSLGLEVLFWAGGELAVGPETPLSGQLLEASAADWDGDGAGDVMARIGSSGVSFLRGLASRDGRLAAPVPVALTGNDGLPFDLTSVLWRTGRLGGATPGPDLSPVVRIGSQLFVGALVFDDATHARLGLAEPRAYVDHFLADLDGDGVDDAIATRPPLAVALVKPSDPPGPAWPFRPWAVASARADQAFLTGMRLPVPGAVPPRERGVIVYGDAIAYVELVDGVPAEVVTPTAVSLANATAAAIADVDGDGLRDLVVSMAVPEDWLVFPGTPDGTFATTPRADLAFAPGIAAFEIGVGRGAAGDDLVVDVPGGVTVLRNDGLGHYR